MDIQQLKIKGMHLIDSMCQCGYSKSYIKLIRHRLNVLCQDSVFGQSFSYEDYYSRIKSQYNPNQLRYLRNQIGVIKAFDCDGVCPGHKQKNNFAVTKNVLTPHFVQLWNLYSSTAEELGHSPFTITNRKGAAIRFFSYLQEHVTAENEISLETVESYFLDKNLVQQRRCRNNQANELMHIRGFLKTIEKRCLFAADLFSKLPTMVQYRYAVEPPEEALFQSILECVTDPDSPICLRDRAIALVAYYLGFRAQDIIQLSINDIDWKNNIVRKMQSKTKQIVELPLRPVVGNAILNYILNERPKISTDIVFLSKPLGVPLKYSALKSILKFILKLIGCDSTPRWFGFHSFRRHFATTMMNQGVDTPLISHMLGHSNPESLHPYLTSDLQRLKDCALSVEDFMPPEGYNFNF